ncbi:hypothetical protein CHUAL_010592 [Chamberlinius hualienensis]
MFSIVYFGIHLFALIFHANVISAQANPTSDHTHLNKLQSRNGYGYGYGYNGYNSYYPVATSYGGLDGVGEIVLGVLATLAGLALLASIVTALAAPLAMFSGRKRRDIEAIDSFQNAATLQKFIQSIDSIEILPQKLMANYLSCSGLVHGKSQCLEKLICEFSKPEAKFGQLEKKAFDVILQHLTDNQFIESEFKNRLLKAKSGHDCKAYQCSDYFKTT